MHEGQGFLRYLAKKLLNAYHRDMQMDKQGDVQQKVFLALARWGVGPQAGILAGVSGGADSVALLHCLNALRLGGAFGKLYAAHLNHGIRGDEARQDAEFVKGLCHEWGIPLFLKTVDVPALAKQSGRGIEETAREARYRFLEEARAEAGAINIAVAHHKNDQAETVLMHLLRGTGPKGLCGMTDRRGNLIRPLMQVSRGQIMAYLQSHGLCYRDDATNQDVSYLRNRIRLQLLPTLERDYNPAIVDGLVRMASLCAEDEAYLSAQAAAALEQCRENGGYRREQLRDLPPALKGRALRLILQEHGALYNSGQEDISRLSELLEARTGAKAPFGNGVWGWTSYQLLCVGILQEQGGEYAIPLKIPGETHTPAGIFHSQFVNDWEKGQNPFVGFLDGGKLPDDTLVRPRRPGDRFYPFGAPGERKLKEYFIDKKVPRRQREGPMVCTGGEVLFLPGYTVSENVRVRPETEQILKIEFIPN